MGKRKLIWSQSALDDMTGIFDYYNERNKSKAYSAKLLNEFKTVMRLIISSPCMGIKTEEENVRYVISGNYALFYEITSHAIEVLIVWDCRQSLGRLAMRIRQRPHPPII
ncbi:MULTISPECIES: type II toxin-antitoxin system RelE/ParE family toxin [Parabacteroides]|uniref:type II toxin-antitoxin system RelE/ParE family toxin n=1 Tax=Parabacteroides TaxID=375288 RepID=UPI0005CA2351|nr:MULTISPECIES: type II toxin-antitoxin system RelE/ParE family toxin [Parabacteroides]MDO5428492.1 type II toxin-antitoxin system RelE/ParE family toxin [Parabacteroides sp.]